MRRRKYGNKKVVFDGHKFDSIAEKNRYIELLFLSVDHDAIVDLVLQPKFKICGHAKDPNGRKLPDRYYRADFMYVDTATGKTIVEDVKSPITAKESTYRLKRHLFLNQYGDKYTFLETYA